MFFGLRLRARLISSDQKKSGVHDCSSSKHGGHEDIVTWTVHEGHVSHQEQLRVAVQALGFVFLVGLVRLVALGCWANRALVQLGICITKFNRNVSDSLFPVFDGLNNTYYPCSTILTLVPEIASTRVDLPCAT